MFAPWTITNKHKSHARDTLKALHKFLVFSQNRFYLCKARKSGTSRPMPFLVEQFIPYDDAA